MKKFLSLVLALVLTMSLVVVPANANDPVAVTDVTLNKGSIALDRGGEETLTATVKPDNATDKTVTWTSDKTDVATVSNGTVTAIKAGTATITAKAGDQTETCTVTVNDKLLPSDIASVTINGRTYSRSNGTLTVYMVNDEEITTPASATTTNGRGEISDVTLDGNKLTLTEAETNLTCEISVTPLSSALTAAAAPAKIVAGGTTELTATHDGSTNTAYTWTLDGEEIRTGKSVNWTAPANGTGNYEITCTAKEGSTEVATGKVTVEVVANTFGFVSTAQILQKGQALARDRYVTFKNTEATTEDLFGNLTGVNYTSSNPTVLTVNETTGQVTAMKDGTAAVTVKGTYLGKQYTGIVSFTVISATAALGSVSNGNNRNYSSTEIKNAVVTAINKLLPSTDKIKADNITGLTIRSVPNAAGEGVLYKTSMTNANKLQAGYSILNSNVIFDAAEGRIGTVSFGVSAETTKGAYNVTLEIPVTSAGSVSDTVYAYVTSSNSVSFELPSGYDTLYYKQGSVSSYDGLWTSANGWSTCSSSVKGTLPLSSFSNTGKTTLSAVGIAGGVAYTGTLTVVLNSYNIEYSGVAGETVTFDQGDFEDFMEEAAEDYGWINTSSSSTAYVKFNRVTFSIPAEKTQGILYNDGEQIKSSSKSSVKECTDLDKVTFAIADKTGLKEVVINFTLYADYYSSERVTYPATRTFSGRVVVNVVHEDIKYTVPVDGSVVFKAEDFQDFFDDTYKNGTLSYVKFTELPKVTDGALYATYSAIYAGTVAEESDKFYYDSSKISDYDLDDVTFRTSLWSKAGTKVYLPFTAYGTKSYQSVDGWVAITVENARTMNFTDVKTGDWFYNNVKNAYAMGLIEGKTTTTFNPNDNMTYAEAVTLAARMNQLYYSGKVTLSNSTTGNWYSSYESYAISKGIISSALGNKANTKITRKDYVDIFYNALPASAYTVRNTVSKIPDLANNTANAKVYAFYRAGILTGYANTPGKTNGAFGPNDNIKRSEVATILIRMMDSGTRVYFTM